MTGGDAFAVPGDRRFWVIVEIVEDIVIAAPVTPIGARRTEFDDACVINQGEFHAVTVRSFVRYDLARMVTKEHFERVYQVAEPLGQLDPGLHSRVRQGAANSEHCSPKIKRLLHPHV
jgi:hypothetical protein